MARNRYTGICPNYCGVSCVDGSCPVALREEYAERGYDLVDDCCDCGHYKGCEDCAWDGTDLCLAPKEARSAAEKGGAGQ